MAQSPAQSLCACQRKACFGEDACWQFLTVPLDREDHCAKQLCKGRGGWDPESCPTRSHLLPSAAPWSLVWPSLSLEMILETHSLILGELQAGWRGEAVLQGGGPPSPVQWHQLSRLLLLLRDAACQLPAPPGCPEGQKHCTGTALAPLIFSEAAAHLHLHSIFPAE